MKSTIRLGLLALSWLAGCAGIDHAAPPPPPSLVDAKRAVVTYLDSGRYEADIAAVANEARATWEERRAGAASSRSSSTSNETALSNTPSLRANDFGFIVYGRAIFRAGHAGSRVDPDGESRAIKPVLALARAARERGIAVFLITGRPERLRAATEWNLRAAGYEWTGVILMPDNLKTQSAVEFKAPERKKITDLGYTVILNVGDQASDLDGGYAERTFKLPNPFYFIP
jgi:acid phosphatase